MGIIQNLKCMEPIVRFNFAAGLLHSISVASMWGLVGTFNWTIPIVSRYSLWKKTNLTNDGRCDAPYQSCKITSQTENLFDLNIIYLVIVDRIVCAVAHFFVCFPPYKKYYLSWLYVGFHPIRWVEYFFSASLLIVVIGILTGYNDIETLVLIFGGVATTMVFGLLMEQTNLIFNNPELVVEKTIIKNITNRLKEKIYKKKKKKELEGVELTRVNDDESEFLLQKNVKRINFFNTSSASPRDLCDNGNDQPKTVSRCYLKVCCFFYGWIPYLFVWGVLFSSFHKSIHKFNETNGGEDVPEWVIVLFFTLFTLYSCFAVVQAWQFEIISFKWLVSLYIWCRGCCSTPTNKEERIDCCSTPTKKEERNRRAEYAYITLSFLAKSALAWQLWFGVTLRDNNVTF